MKCALNFLLISLLICVVFSRVITEENHLAKRGTIDYTKKKLRNNKLYYTKKGDKSNHDFEYISFEDGKLYAENDDEHRTYIFKLFDLKTCKNYKKRELLEIYLTDSNNKKTRELFQYEKLGKNQKSNVKINLVVGGDTKCRMSATFKYNDYEIYKHKGK
ncbi:hypothetical protein PIROE2DRAFT_17196 [Piromyces sp. E2]|nr:hypothetical protein PIROE2DRAFT_17196 [Piromyces sp. E2]|eukprot:OUM57727.1 hypothetical protein PIROE2DRAFT_17196 [Piromyces sp. E2]